MVLGQRLLVWLMKALNPGRQMPFSYAMVSSALAQQEILSSTETRGAQCTWCVGRCPLLGPHPSGTYPTCVSAGFFRGTHLRLCGAPAHSLWQELVRLSLCALAYFCGGVNVSNTNQTWPGTSDTNRLHSVAAAATALSIVTCLFSRKCLEVQAVIHLHACSWTRVHRRLPSSGSMLSENRKHSLEL